MQGESFLWQSSLLGDHEDNDETGQAAGPGTQQVSGADHGIWMLRPTVLCEVGSEAHTEKPPFSHQDLSPNPDASTCSR